MTIRELVLMAWLLGTATGCTRAEPSGVTDDRTARKMAAASVRLETDLPALEATEWINSDPLTPASLGGKVVLVQFWTYSCINWRRTLPYLRAWSERYGDRGLTLVGVHSPEFEFEKDAANVREAVRDLRIAFPVAVDSGWAIWRKFGNDSWPALYLFDGQGHIRHHRAGEGEYERVEALLRQLLQETGAKELGREVGSVEGHGPELEADWANLRTPETYLGFARARNFVSPNPVAAGQLLTFTAPTGMALNSWALAGVWSIQRESVVSHQPFARIAFRFHARDVHVVMGPAIAGTSVKFRVHIDGQALRGRHGVDVDEHGSGLLNARRMYHLVRQSHPIADRDFEIEFLDPGAAAYSFTFG
jgi:thiol-disulfide isomerase/thioredoxin